MQLIVMSYNVLFLVCFSGFQSIGKNYRYAAKYNQKQGKRLANSSEFDFICGVDDYKESIKLRQMSRIEGSNVTGAVNISSHQENEPDNLETSPFHPSTFESPSHQLSASHSNQLTDVKFGPTKYDSIHSMDSTMHLEDTDIVNGSSYPSRNIDVQPSHLISSTFATTNPKYKHTRSCLDDPVCNAKFSKLTSELEDAKKQVQYLEDMLKMKDVEGEEEEDVEDNDGSSTDADFIDLDQGSIVITFLYIAYSHKSVILYFGAENIDKIYKHFVSF